MVYRLDPLSSTTCQDLCGKSTRLLGGIAASAEAMACAKELQGDGTIHGHGFLAVANAFQHSTVADIGKLLMSRIHGLTETEIAGRVIAFTEHLHREDHFDHDEHQEQLASLEKEFHNNNCGPPVNVFLSVRPRFFYDSTSDCSHIFFPSEFRPKLLQLYR